MARPRFSYANVTATLALVLAMGVGTSYAAQQLPKNSVGPKQIKSNAVRSTEIKNGKVSAKDLRPATLADLKAPRAYGVFRADGTLVAAKSRNVTITKLDAIDPGVYCVNPTPASGIDADKTTIVATADFNDGSGFHHHVQTVLATAPAADNDCPSNNSFELLVDNLVGGTGDFARTDAAVSFVIP